MHHPQLAFDSREHREVEYTGENRGAEGQPHARGYKELLCVMDGSCLFLPVSAAFEAVKRGLHAPVSALIIIKHTDRPVCHNLSFKNTQRHAGFKLTTRKQLRITARHWPFFTSCA